MIVSRIISDQKSQVQGAATSIASRISKDSIDLSLGIILEILLFDLNESYYGFSEVLLGQ
jgi:hypothetical protein